MWHSHLLLLKATMKHWYIYPIKQYLYQSLYESYVTKKKKYHTLIFIHKYELFIFNSTNMNSYIYSTSPMYIIYKSESVGKFNITYKYDQQI